MRIQDTEASLGDKIHLMQVVGHAAQGISELNEMKSLIIDDEKVFFEIAEHPMVQAGRITRQLSKTKVMKGKANKFL